MPHLTPGLTHMLAGLPVQDFQESFASAKVFISFSVVLISGPAMYNLGQTAFNAIEKDLMIFCFSASDIVLGSATMPAFAPPNGKSASAFLYVMARANRATSSAETVGVIRMPPLPRPLLVLSMTKKPCIFVFGSYTSRIFSGPMSSCGIMCVRTINVYLKMLVGDRNLYIVNITSI